MRLERGGPWDWSRGLREQEGWDVTEIGMAMGWNVKRVYNELFKARRSLNEWQARRAKDHEP